MLSVGRSARILAIVLLMLACAYPALAAKNVIIMIGDGMGPEQVKLGSYYVAGKAGALSFEPYYRCSVTTSSLGGGTTDSAAAATALATGNKAANGVISQAPDGHAYKTVLETARDMGKRTGLVTTVPISDATPAAFGAHESNRSNMSGIIGDYLTSTKPNVLFGGGSSNWTTDQITTAQQEGYHFVSNSRELIAINSAKTEYALGLFATGDMTFEVNRTVATTEPHLTQMAAAALSIVSKDPDGFFLMIEGGEIDHAGHRNLTKEAAGEVSEFNNAVKMVLRWMHGRKDTLLIVTADHETGGLKDIVNNGARAFPTASWSTGGHTNTKVPCYVTGADADMINRYTRDRVIDNTDIYRLMDKALNNDPRRGKH